MRLTPTGRVLVGYARRVLRLEAEMVAAVRQEEAGEGGKVVIAASTSAGATPSKARAPSHP